MGTGRPPAPVATATLQFDPAQDALPGGGRLSSGLSAIVATGDTLWVTHDETVSIERLQRQPSRRGVLRFAAHRRFDLGQFVALPARASDTTDGATPEADIEALSCADGYLWLAGSHSALRDDAKGATTAAAIAALANVRRSGNRFLLARIPLDATAAEPTLARRVVGPDGRTRTAARLPGGRKHDALTRALRDDPHLGPFIALPSKDNGFDIEGLAAAPDGRLFVGLRGPVLDGWACILELRVGTHRRRDDTLVLQPLPAPARADVPGARYRKHFLDLSGNGVRDLCFAGRDLLILTGPPMRGKGASTIRCWRNALAARTGQLLHEDRLPTLLELSYRTRKDHAEGIALVGTDKRRVRLLMLYDSADDARRVPPAGLRADFHDVTLP